MAYHASNYRPLAVYTLLVYKVYVNEHSTNLGCNHPFTRPRYSRQRHRVYNQKDRNTTDVRQVGCDFYLRLDASLPLRSFIKPV